MRNPRALLLLSVLVVVIAMGGAPSETVELPDLGEIRVSGPYRHDNLSIFLLHGEDASDRKLTFLSLRDAMKQKKVVVKETGDVNRLVIKNVSDDHVLIQAGDIVRGGKQDRLIAYDLLLRPRSGKLSIGAFCVEQGRWHGRGTEAVTVFASSSNRAAGNALKTAYRSAKSQREVWNNVLLTQGRLRESVSVDVRASRSPTSLELSLDHKAVKKATTAYTEALAGTIDEHDDAVGLIASVDGEIQSATLYAWHDLFVAVWPQLLAEISSAAVASEKRGEAQVALSARQVEAMLVPTEGSESKTTKILPGASEDQTRSADSILFVSRDSELGWVRIEALKQTGDD